MTAAPGRPRLLLENVVRDWETDRSALLVFAVGAMLMWIPRKARMAGGSTMNPVS